MSNNTEAKMVVEFRSTQPSQSVTGFEARYSFVTSEWTSVWMNEWMDGWMDGWMVGWMDG